ncbi:hypothetical protein R1T08_24090 [Streptomyces sp. SBC-4]|nr:hypothetical protein [Streptomyces sp. SBC-4]MDV5147171.1 hypothetical protein [Streptomyces sp. SBC-4]
MTGVPALDAVALWAGIIAAVGGALAVLYRWGRSLRRASQRVGQVLADWTGEQGRPGVAARAGVMERLGDIDTSVQDLGTRLAAVEHELHPNSGSSLRDAVDRVDARTAAHLDKKP